MAALAVLGLAKHSSTGEHRLMEHRPPIFVEISPGELIDKLTILEIKQERIVDPGKRGRVATELQVVATARRALIPESIELATLTAELKEINGVLWQVEDDIRGCEQRGDFGPRFIELARAVYHQNDRRAAVKRQINDALGARLVEVKSYPDYSPVPPLNSGLELDPTYQSGLLHHQAGRLAQAEQAYREVLQIDPTYFDAIHMLGVLCCQTARAAECVALLEDALRQRPLAPDVNCHLGAGLRGMNRLSEAEACYRQALAVKPDYPEAHNNLGLLLKNSGRLPEAAAALESALEISPQYAAAHNNLGLVRQAQARQAEAEVCYRRALELNPDSSEVHYNLGITLQTADRLSEAAAAFSRALEISPNYAAAHHNLGLIRRAQTRYPEAEASCRRALAINPQIPEAYNSLGVILKELDRLPAAAAAFSRALEISAHYAEAHHNLGLVLHLQSRYAEAEACYRRALELNPDSPDMHYNLGITLQALDRLPDAAAALERAIAISPQLAAAHNSLGLIRQLERRYTEAEACYRRALEARPDSAPALNNLGTTLKMLGRLPAAAAALRQALEISPQDAGAHKNLGMVQLLRGDLAGGWPEYEWRWKCPGCQPRNFTQPPWDGSPLGGRTILLYAEQGLGDTLQFIRYARLVQARGGRVLFECQAALQQILARTPGIDVLIPRGTKLPSFDVHSPLLSLPGLLGTTLDNIPCDVPYLFADPALVEYWRAELATIPGFKIGMAWQGSPAAPLDWPRSAKLANFAAVARLPGIQLISLQKGSGTEQLADFREQFSIIDFGERLDATTGPMMDTAAIMCGLDLVVTIDTSLLHLAGALGVPVWMATPFAPDWRWLLDREDSPWYPTLRLFRQPPSGDWSDVFERMAAALIPLVAARYPPCDSI